MRKLVGQFLVAWLIMILAFVTGAIMIFFVELIGGVMYLFPLILFSLFVLREVKSYSEKSKKGDR
ncbi:ATP synthase subunit I [Bacillus thuringiensis]|uniref:ATP synthase subunit I n=1 Tax=Bacillus thuringiensis TaxID=1428 RepID=UPI00159C9716|nr:ATP synthase subunit I [Bacillus thuringiensis]